MTDDIPHTPIDEPTNPPGSPNVKYVLCHACHQPIKVEDLAGTVQIDGKDAWFHKQLPCLVALKDAASTPIDGVVDETQQLIWDELWKSGLMTGEQATDIANRLAAAISRHVAEAVRAGRIEELKTAWGKYAPGDIGNKYMNDRIKELENNK